MLLTLRNRLVCDRGSFEATSKEQRLLSEEHDMLVVYKSMIDHLTSQIKKLEIQIQSIIDRNADLKNTYDLLTSMKGIGLVIAANMITSTHNFTRFTKWRKFACYIGPHLLNTLQAQVSGERPRSAL